MFSGTKLQSGLVLARLLRKQCIIGHKCMILFRTCSTMADLAEIVRGTFVEDRGGSRNEREGAVDKGGPL